MCVWVCGCLWCVLPIQSPVTLARVDSREEGALDIAGKECGSYRITPSFVPRALSEIVVCILVCV